MEGPSLVRQLLEPEPPATPTPGEQRGFGSVPWSMADMVVVTLFAGVVELALAPLAVVPVGRHGNRPAEFFFQVLLSYGLVLVAVWGLGMRRYRARPDVLGFRAVDVRGLAGLLGLLSLVIVALNVAVGLIARLSRPHDLFALGDGVFQIVLLGVLVMVAAPLAEEIFFRGFLLQGLSRRIRFWPAAILTSALFAVAHIWWQLYLPTFVLAMAFAWLFWRTGSLWAPIAAHATINGTSFMLALILHR